MIDSETRGKNFLLVLFLVPISIGAAPHGQDGREQDQDAKGVARSRSECFYPTANLIKDGPQSGPPFMGSRGYPPGFRRSHKENSPPQAKKKRGVRGVPPRHRSSLRNTLHQSRIQHTVNQNTPFFSLQIRFHSDRDRAHSLTFLHTGPRRATHTATTQ